ncbi:homologous-pairing protein 2 homolog isoform X2 [Prorops nasuta]|uniref:homologous-pairing protein 2 homolog isoform X2 n=1 Tax=Prorops nasuta TaxID=863751 RepID=UPI0034CE8620
MALEEVYQFMKTQNRPYSVGDIVSNLKNQFGKSAVQKACDQLVNKEKLFEKAYGKQKIYCIVQDSKYDPDELMRIDKELQAHANEVESKCQEMEKKIKSQEALLSSLKSTMTLEEAQQEKARLEESVNALTHKLDDLMASAGTEDLTKLKRKAQSALNEYSSEYNKRRRLCTEIIECILENFPGTKNELFEDIVFRLHI